MINKVKSFFFEIKEDCASKLDSADYREPNVADSDQGCVAGMLLAEARFKRMKKVAVINEMG